MSFKGFYGWEPFKRCCVYVSAYYSLKLWRTERNYPQNRPFDCLRVLWHLSSRSWLNHLAAAWSLKKIRMETTLLKCDNYSLPKNKYLTKLYPWETNFRPEAYIDVMQGIYKYHELSQSTHWGRHTVLSVTKWCSDATIAQNFESLQYGLACLNNSLEASFH